MRAASVLLQMKRTHQQRPPSVLSRSSLRLSHCRRKSSMNKSPHRHTRLSSRHRTIQPPHSQQQPRWLHLRWCGAAQCDGVQMTAPSVKCSPSHRSLCMSLLMFCLACILSSVLGCNRPDVIDCKGPFLASKITADIRAARSEPRLLLLLPRAENDRSALLRYCNLLSESSEGARCGLALVPGGRLALYSPSSSQSDSDVSLMGLLW